jgi:hypothetical protein
MRARGTTTNRGLVIFFLAVVTSILLPSSSLAAHASTPSAPAFSTTLHLTQPTPLSASLDPAAACVHHAFPTASSSIAPHFKRRVFVEDTVPPSLEALRSVRVEPATKSRRRLHPLPPVIRDSAASVANRQRAP